MTTFSIVRFRIRWDFTSGRSIASRTMNPIFMRIFIHRCCARRISGNSWLGLKCSGRHNVISLRKQQRLDCVKQEAPPHEAVWFRDSTGARRDRTLQGLPSERLAGSPCGDPALEHWQLLDFSERRLPLRVLRIPWRGSRHGYREYRSRPKDKRMVVDHDANTTPARYEKDGRVVGGDGRSFPL